MINADLSLDDALNAFVAAEDFLDYFAIAYDPEVVRVNRLYILLRFHGYLRKQLPNLPPGAATQRAILRLWFERAYQDFAASPALTAAAACPGAELSACAPTCCAAREFAQAP